VDSEFDHDLRAALRREAYRPGPGLDAGRLRALLGADERRRRSRRRRELLAGVAVAAVAVVGIALWPSIQLAPSVGQASSPPCVVARPETRGAWWVEVGGPHAYFNVEPGTLYATDNTWPIIVRFDPDAESDKTVSMWAEPVSSGQRVMATFNSRMDPKRIYRFASPAPDLPGGWYLFQQRIPSPGCWRLTASIDGRAAGTAIIEVRSGAPRREPSRAPLPPTPRIASPAATEDSGSR
jgi:hypothetical protein